MDAFFFFFFLLLLLSLVHAPLSGTKNLFHPSAHLLFPHLSLLLLVLLFLLLHLPTLGLSSHFRFSPFYPPWVIQSSLSGHPKGTSICHPSLKSLPPAFLLYHSLSVYGLSFRSSLCAGQVFFSAMQPVNGKTDDAPIVCYKVHGGIDIHAHSIFIYRDPFLASFPTLRTCPIRKGFLPSKSHRRIC